MREMKIVGLPITMAASGRVGAAALALLLGMGAAVAGPVELQGMYGNKVGCARLYNADRDDDSLVSLSTEAYETFATSCEFVHAAKALDGSQVATMLCSHEGEAYRTIDFMHIVRAGEGDAYEMYSQTGELIATVQRCE